MMKETFQGYSIEAMPIRFSDSAWGVSAVVRRSVDGVQKERIVYADDKIRYLLEIEAAKEGINLGRNLIKNGLVKF